MKIKFAILQQFYCPLGANSALIYFSADIQRKTTGERQTPMHYAARYNAVEAMNTLLELGASILEKDYKSQMPLYVAADAGRSEYNYTVRKLSLSVKLPFWDEIRIG